MDTRYERSRPGELVHIDVKRLGRIEGGAGKRVRDGLHKHWNRCRTDAEGRRRLTVGWEFVHIAVDDHSRLANAEVLPDQKASTAIGFLRRARAFYARYGRTRDLRRDRPSRRATPGDDRPLNAVIVALGSPREPRELSCERLQTMAATGDRNGFSLVATSSALAVLEPRRLWEHPDSGSSTTSSSCR